MGKRPKGNPVKVLPMLKPKDTGIILTEEFKQQLEAIDGWPSLTVAEWMPPALKYFEINGKLHSSDKRYKKVHDHLHNIRRWQVTKAKRRAEAQERANQLEEDLQPVQDIDDQIDEVIEPEVFSGFSQVHPLQQSEQVVDQGAHETISKLITENKELKDEISRLKSELESERRQKCRLRDFLSQSTNEAQDILKTVKDQEWESCLESYLDELKISTLKPKTIKNYDSYLRPWVSWLNQDQQARSIAISSQTLKFYLQKKYSKKSYYSYMRIGRQIKDFMNRYLQNPISVIKSVNHQRAFENVQMPAESMPKLHDFLTVKLDQLYQNKTSSQVNKQISKVLAIHFVLLTGCRPSEAAYVVLNKTIVPNDIRVPQFDRQLKATAPWTVTKTQRDYFWLLPNEAKKVATAIMDHQEHEFADYIDLKESLHAYFQNQIVAKAGVLQRHTDTRHYNLRSIRAYRATEWLQLSTEYKIMDWSPAPPNPLSHTNPKTVIQYYAAKGSNDEWKARSRCYMKYSKNPDLRQPWMDDYDQEERKKPTLNSNMRD